jgi:hypothetical protein
VVILLPHHGNGCGSYYVRNTVQDMRSTSVPQPDQS